MQQSIMPQHMTHPFTFTTPNCVYLPPKIVTCLV